MLTMRTLISFWFGLMGVLTSLGLLEAETNVATNGAVPHELETSIPIKKRMPWWVRGGGDADSSNITEAVSFPEPPKQQRRRGGRASRGKLVDDHCMPSLFDETDKGKVYDKYSACLAATEGMRRVRDRDLTALEAQSAGPRFRLSKKSKQEKARANIETQYVQNAAKVLRAMGMTVEEFQEIGRHVSQNKSLKAKVLEQAYLYRMAAAVKMDRSPLDPFAPESAADENFVLSKPLPSPGKGRRAPRRRVTRDELQRFSASVSDVEALRQDWVSRLKKSLQVDGVAFQDDGRMNEYLSDPELFPFLHPKAKAVVKAFPMAAAEIVEKHGLKVDQFNIMFQEMKTNPRFQWKVERQIISKKKAG